jgi:hypothetical protein
MESVIHLVVHTRSAWPYAMPITFVELALLRRTHLHNCIRTKQSRNRLTLPSPSRIIRCCCGQDPPNPPTHTHISRSCTTALWQDGSKGKVDWGNVDEVIAAIKEKRVTHYSHLW